MKIKLDNYDIGILINGLLKFDTHYDDKTNNDIDNIIFRLVSKNENLKTCRKILFEQEEIIVVVKCLMEWRNQEIQTVV